MASSVSTPVGYTQHIFTLQHGQVASLAKATEGSSLWLSRLPPIPKASHGAHQQNALATARCGFGVGYLGARAHRRACSRNQVETEAMGALSARSSKCSTVRCTGFHCDVHCGYTRGQLQLHAGTRACQTCAGPASPRQNCGAAVSSGQQLPCHACCLLPAPCEGKCGIKTDMLGYHYAASSPARKR